MYVSGRTAANSDKMVHLEVNTDMTLLMKANMLGFFKRITVTAIETADVFWITLPWPMGHSGMVTSCILYALKANMQVANIFITSRGCIFP